MLETLPTEVRNPNFVFRGDTDSFAFMKTFGFLFELVDSLEPQRLTGFWRTSHKSKKLTEPDLFMYTHSIIRFKDILLYFVPGLRDVLPMVEWTFKTSAHIVLLLCDHAHKVPHRSAFICVTALVLDEIKHLKGTQTVDPSLLDHVQAMLECRLTVFCARTFDFNGSGKLKHNSEQKLAAAVTDYVGASICLPPHYRGRSSELRYRIRVSKLPYFRKTNPEPPACLLNRSASIRCDLETPHIHKCCCGWILDSIPPGVLAFSGYSVESFAHDIGTGHCTVNFAGIKKVLETSSFITVFGILGKSLRLQEITALIQEALYFFLWMIFSWEDCCQVKEKLCLTDDQLGVQAKEHCRILYQCSLMVAVNFLIDFWSGLSYKRLSAILETRDPDHRAYELVSEFQSWKESKQVLEEHIRVIVALHVIRRDMMTKSALGEQASRSEGESSIAPEADHPVSENSG